MTLALPSTTSRSATSSAPVGSLRPRWLRPSAFAMTSAAHLSFVGLFLWTAEPLSSASDAHEVAFVQDGEAMQEAKSDSTPDEQAETTEPTTAQAAAEAQPEEAPPVKVVDAPPPLAMEKPQEIAPDAIVVPLVDKQPDDVRNPSLKPQQQPKQAESEPTAEDAPKDTEGKIRRVAVAAAEAFAPSAAAAERAGATDGRRVQNSASKAHYGARVLQEIQRHMFYPTNARSASVTGRAIVVFTVGAEGRITDRQIAQSTGNATLDDAALAMLDAVKAPPPPAGRFYGKTTIKFDIRH